MKLDLDLPPQTARVALRPPVVYVEPSWEYKDVVRDEASAELLEEAALNALGSEGWELTGVIAVSGRVHFYFKRWAS